MTMLFVVVIASQPVNSRLISKDNVRAEYRFSWLVEQSCQEQSKVNRSVGFLAV